ncbi:RagB/SusD domain protein [Paludibacter propionicigenes WB4]|uniref:RagB/SusD domain protein n=1 Tax=Paludibacter propionicigenes (strain DSM 17365 / JCM 13257 / WB4) TaxID=694427 RepID=E4T1N7_PALPW|nr:RagB/SusD family nutrient uptake outer membrane protein [Paludibacter propionicigenes]ADQ78631.1 RagB/SusD domain protein [Paludibacter propionicigenes WB4]
MKRVYKYFYQLIVLSSLVIMPACNTLDVDPADKITAEQAFKNKAGIEKGILGSYSELQSFGYYGRSYLIASDMAADNLVHPTDATQVDYAEIDNNTLLSENGVVENIWASIYSAINVANSVIDKVPGMAGMTDDEKAAALGELYFLRGLNHFNLMNYFGAIPVKTTATVGTKNLDVPRNTTTEVFTQIITDLKYAEAHLPASASTKTRASKYAATALLARVYLYQKNYALAYEKANDVITKGGYTFLPSFAQVFATEGSPETIFEVEFDAKNRNRVAEFNFPKVMNGKGEAKPDPTLVTAYEVTDKRLVSSIADSVTYNYAQKYKDMSLGDKNIIVLRLAEMYLIRAEAEAHSATGVISNVQDDINKIRNRAGLANTDAATMPDLLLAIEKERRLEFAFEGHRWFDLVRTNRALDLLPNVTKSYKMLFPIPLSEINANSKMKQNPGYN